jgi:hypothetical protein
MKAKFAPLCLLVAIAPLANAIADTRVTFEGESKDPWDGFVEQPVDCQSVARELVFRVRVDQLTTATTKLANDSVVALEDADARVLLGVQTAESRETLGEQLLAGRIADLSEQRRVVLSERIGSWSHADEINLDALRQRMADAPRHPLRLYLVRGLAADANRIEAFDVSMCSDAVQTMTFSTPGTRAPAAPARIAFVVLLTESPSRSTAVWTYDLLDR